MKRLLVLTATVVLTAMLSQAALAIPALQIYIPDATWDASTETWVTGASDFELWVIAANTDSKPIYDLTLVVALADGQDPVTGALSIDGADFNTFMNGTPPSWGDNQGSYPGHGIYPTKYTELYISSLVNTYPETVHNTQPGEYADTAPGKIFKFDISTSYDFLHFDAYGYHRESDGKFKFVPPSHDGEKGRIPPPTIPEPTTLLLVGSALAVVGGIRKLRK